MSPGSWLWEAQCVVFYGVLKPLGRLVAGRNEYLADPGSGRLNVLYSTVSGVSWISRILALGGSKCRILRGLEAPGGPVEAGSDECLEDRVPGGLHVSYSTTSGGSWEGQIPTT